MPDVKVSVGLPTHHVDAGPDLVSADAVADLARAAEDLGFDAVYVTEHPFPADDWLAHGGHHALDPLVTLAVAATATSRIGLHTHLFVPAYRNPFLAAKGIATLDVLSGGRVVLGVGTGYLAAEFAALGASFDDRNDRTDEALLAMRRAWTGESVQGTGPGWHAEGNTMRPRPVQRPHPPIWVGGNSRRAVRRAVEHGTGWAPFPTGRRAAAATRTAPLRTAEDLADRLAYAAEHAAEVGRTDPLQVMFIPEGLSMDGDRPFDAAHVIASCAALGAVGVGWITVSFPDADRRGQLAAMERFARDVLPALDGLGP